MIWVPWQDVISPKIKMNFGVARFIVRILKEVVMANRQNEIRKFAEAHCITYLQVTIRPLVWSSRDNDVSILDEPDDLRFQESAFIVFIHSLGFKAAPSRSLN